MSFWDYGKYAFLPGIPFFAADDLGLFGNDEIPPYPGAMPSTPGYSPVYDPSTMASLPGTEDRLNTINPNRKGLEKFREEATRSRPSVWARLSKEKNFSEEAGARDRNRAVGRNAVAQAESDLAMRGGLSSGARERIARKGATDVLAMDQDVSRQANTNEMQIDINDEQNRISQLSMLPGMENQAYQLDLSEFDRWNAAKNADIQRLADENARRNAFNMKLYETEMEKYAADRQAHATENSGK
jgi:hypothetical protein